MMYGLAPEEYVVTKVRATPSSSMWILYQSSVAGVAKCADRPDRVASSLAYGSTTVSANSPRKATSVPLPASTITL